jgi:hypothetical protein
MSITPSLKAAVRQLLWDLDPIGVGDDRAEVPDEYDDAVDALCGLIQRGVVDENAYEAWWYQYVSGLGVPVLQRQAAEFRQQVGALAQSLVERESR